MRAPGEQPMPEERAYVRLSRVRSLAVLDPAGVAAEVPDPEPALAKKPSEKPASPGP